MSDGEQIAADQTGGASLSRCRLKRVRLRRVPTTIWSPASEKLMRSLEELRLHKRDKEWVGNDDEGGGGVKWKAEWRGQWKIDTLLIYTVEWMRPRYQERTLGRYRSNIDRDHAEKRAITHIFPSLSIIAENTRTNGVSIFPSFLVQYRLWPCRKVDPRYLFTFSLFFFWNYEINRETRLNQFWNR